MAARKPLSAMTLEELEWKRMNDRVNQQYSRARKKRRLEEVERKNKELVEELENVKQALTAARQREDALRAAIDGVYGILGGSSVPPGQDQQCQSTAANVDQPNSQPSTFSHGLGIGDWALSTTFCPTTTITSDPHATDALNAQDPQLVSTFNGNDGSCILNLPLEIGHGAWVNLLDQATLEGPSMDELVSAAALSVAEPASKPGKSVAIDGRESSNPTSQDLGRLSSSASPTNLQPSVFRQAQTVETWHSLPLHTAPITELDGVILSLTAIGRHWAHQQGRQLSELAEPSFPSVSSLLNPSTDDEASNPISTAVAKHTLTTWVKSFPRKVAFHYTVGHLLRWLVNPNEQNFNQLPTFLRPTLIQRTVPHPAWVDTVPWPEARDRIIQRMDFNRYDDFRRVTGKASSVNWPHSDADIFLAKGDKSQMVLNPIFISHIRKVNNWTNSSDLGKEFPFLQGWPTLPPSGVYQWP